MITLVQFMKDMRHHKDLSYHKIANALFDEYCKANGIHFRDPIESSLAKRMFWIGYSIKKVMNDHVVEISEELVRDKTSLYKDKDGLPKGIVNGST